MTYFKQKLLIFFFWMLGPNLLSSLENLVLKTYSDRLDPHPAKEMATEFLSLKKVSISVEELLKTIIYCLELPMIKWILHDGNEAECNIFLSEVQVLIKAAHQAFVEENIYLQKVNIILIGIKISSLLTNKDHNKELLFLNFWKKFFYSTRTTTDEMNVQTVLEEEMIPIIKQSIKMLRLIWIKNGFFLSNKKLLKNTDE